MKRSRPGRLILLLMAAAISNVGRLEGQESLEDQGYTGTFVSIGLGGGATDCFNEAGCYHVVAGHARVGYRQTPRLGFAAGWEGFASIDYYGVGLISAQLLFYPTGRKLFGLVGAGLAFGRGDSAAGGTVGIGYDIPLNRSATVALTPYAGMVLTGIGEYDRSFIYGAVAVTFK